MILETFSSRTKFRALVDILSLVALLAGWLLFFPVTKNGFNTDAIAYFRMAQYWAAGAPSLAISGYWGPLISWIMIPISSFSSDPAIAGRATMLFSTIAFQIGAITLFRNSPLNRKWYILAVSATALQALLWSAKVITPDLLLSGLLLGGYSLFQQAQDTSSMRQASFAGLLFGLAYLAKTPGLPLAIGLMITICVLEVLIFSKAPKIIARRFLVAFATMMLVVAPWVTTLSIHYGEFTWASAPGTAIQWTLGNAHSSFQQFHRPRDGRITSWEEPTEFEGGTTLDVGLTEIAIVVYRNYKYISQHLKSFDQFGMLFALATLAFLLGRRERDQQIRERWSHGIAAVLVISSLYLFSFAEEQRYFWICFPLLLSASVGLLNHLDCNNYFKWPSLLDRKWIENSPLHAAYLLLTISLFSTPLNELRWVTYKKTTQYTLARAIAGEMNTQSVLGPVAALGGSNIWLYVALLGNVQSYGKQQNIYSIDELVYASPRFIFVESNHSAIPILSQDDRFVERTSQLIPASLIDEEVANFRIFEQLDNPEWNR